jgi:hypothetical protein
VLPTYGPLHVLPTFASEFAALSIILFRKTHLGLHSVSLPITSAVLWSVLPLSLSIRSCRVARLRTARPLQSGQATDCTTTGFDYRQRQEFVPFYKTPSRLLSGYRGQGGRGVNSTAHLHLAPRLRMNGSVTPLCAWTGRTVHVLLYIYVSCCFSYPSPSRYSCLNSVQLAEYSTFCSVPFV